jgi:hypothetical protein
MGMSDQMNSFFPPMLWNTRNTPLAAVLPDIDSHAHGQSMLAYAAAIAPQSRFSVMTDSIRTPACELVQAMLTVANITEGRVTYPLPPSADAQVVAALVQSRSTAILIGVVFMTVSSVLYLPWTMLLSDLIRPVEGNTYFLSGTQLVAGLMAQMTYFLPPFFWGAAAFRPERAPQITQALVDTGWLLFITAIGPFILQYATLAIAIWRDERQVPGFPRWVGYLQIWVSVSFLPAVLPFFMKSGPFAWNGLFVWWIPLTLFVAWFVAMLILARKAVLRDA